MRYIKTTEYYSVIKNNVIMKFTGKWIATEEIILSEVIQTQVDKHCPYSLIIGYYNCEVEDRHATIHSFRKAIPRRVQRENIKIYLDRRNRKDFGGGLKADMDGNMKDQVWHHVVRY